MVMSTRGTPSRGRSIGAGVEKNSSSKRTNRSKSRSKSQTSTSSTPAKKSAKSVGTRLRASSGDKEVWKVFFFVPNLIGYLRVICTFLSLYLGEDNLSTGGSNWGTVVVLYLMSFVGDLFDGMAARRFNQSSTYGAVLDMLTDRITTAGMLVLLGWMYPQFRLWYFGVLALDIVSHWLQMYSSVLCNVHHKSEESNAERFFLVRWFYGNYPFFGYLCVGAELFYVLHYCSFYSSADWISNLWKFCFPGMVLKNIVNLCQLGSAAWMIAAKDVKERANK